MIRPVCLRPLATSRISWKICSPTSLMVASPVAITPASTSIRSGHCFASGVRDATLITGAIARPYGRSAARREHMHVHRCGQLQGAADKIACRRGREDKPLLCHSFSRAEDSRNSAGARLRNRAKRLLHDVRKAALLVSGRRIGAAIHSASMQILVVPGHLYDQLLRDFLHPPRVLSARWIASRTSVTSENITVAPALTSRSAA